MSDLIRDFQLNVAQEALDDLHRRITATRFPDRETVEDRTQGPQVETNFATKHHCSFWFAGC